MTRTVKAGERGVDFSFARPPASRLIELGYTFVVGYISVPPAAPAKNITRAQMDEYRAAGLEPFLVWEMSASRANLGANYGTLDGIAAKQEAFARGYTSPILVADDTNTTTGVLGAIMAVGRLFRSLFLGSGGNIDAQEAYMRAFAKACAPYDIGIYGDCDILERCLGLWRIGWLPNAWAWSGSSRAAAEARAKALGAHVLQRKGFYIDNVWAVDPNEAIADFPTPVTPPPIGDDDMKIANNAEVRTMPYGQAAPFTAVFAVGDFKRNIGGEEYRELYGNAPAVALSNAALDAIPDYVPGQSGAVFPQRLTATGTISLHDETLTIAGTVG